MGSTKNDERLTVFDGLAVFRGKGLNDAVLVSFNFVEELHGFDNADHLPFLHGVAHLNERRCAGRRRTVKSAHHRARDGWQGGLSSILSGSRGRRGCGCRSRHCLRHGRNGYRSGRLHDGGCRNGRAVDDANVVFAFRDFKFGNAAFAHEVDQCLEFAKVHFVSAMNVSKWAPDVWAAGAGEPHGADGTESRKGCLGASFSLKEH